MAHWSELFPGLEDIVKENKNTVSINKEMFGELMEGFHSKIVDRQKEDRLKEQDLVIQQLYVLSTLITVNIDGNRVLNSTTENTVAKKIEEILNNMK